MAPNSGATFMSFHRANGVMKTYTSYKIKKEAGAETDTVPNPKLHTHTHARARAHTHLYTRASTNKKIPQTHVQTLRSKYSLKLVFQFSWKFISRNKEIKPIKN